MNHVAEENANYKKFWKDLVSGRFVSMVKESSKGGTISNATEVFNIMKPIYEEHPDIEVLYGIFLNPQNKILAIEKMFSGTITHSSVYPREIIKHMIRLKASSLVMVHNHPSGSIEPSSADIEITNKVFIALSSIDAALHDHIIIGEGLCSLCDEGFIRKFKSNYNRLLNE